MTNILPIKLSIQDFSLTSSSFSIDDLLLSISFNHVSCLFAAPFMNLSVQLLNFPLATVMHFRFYQNNQCKSESQHKIDSLQHKKRIEATVELKSPEELNSPEQFRPLEITSQALEHIGTFKLIIEREDSDSKECQLSNFIENYNTVSEKTLEIIMEMNKNVEIEYDNSVNNLGMELEAVNELQEITPQQVKSIKCLLLGVNEKFKVFELYRKRSDELRMQVIEEQKSRENMQNAFKKACKEYIYFKNQLDGMVSQLNKRCDTFAKENIHLEKTAKDYEEYKKNNHIEVELLNAKIYSIEKEKALDVTTRNLIASLESNVAFIEETGKVQRNEFNKTVQNSNQSLSEHQSKIQDLSQENINLANKIQVLLAENLDLKNQNDKLVTESISVNSLKYELQSRIICIQELEDKTKKLELTAAQYKEDYTSCKSQMQALSQDFDNGSKILHNDKVLLTSSNTRLTEENLILKQEINELTKKVLDAEYNLLKRTQTINNTEFSKNTAESARLLNECKAYSETSLKFDIDITQEFNHIVKSTLESSEKLLTTQRVQTKLIRFLCEKENELQILREIVVELQKERQVYIPVRGDVIDNTLANYLNSRPGRLEVPFIRLDTGVYLFGTKRVMLRVENVGLVSK